MEGYLSIKIHFRRKRYCVLRDRLFSLYNSKEEALNSSKKPRKEYLVVACKDFVDVNGKTREVLLGGNANAANNPENCIILYCSKLDKKNNEQNDFTNEKVATVSDVELVGSYEDSQSIASTCPSSNSSSSSILSPISSPRNNSTNSNSKSKVILVETDTYGDKREWLRVINSLGMADKHQIITELLCKDDFDAHDAVSLMYAYRFDDKAIDLIVDRFRDYASENIDDVEFYLPQIINQIVYMDSCKAEKLVQLMLSIVKAKGYVENLENSFHIGLQLFWLLEGMIQDNNPKTYNTCAKLLMTIEAEIVNQHFQPNQHDIVEILSEVPGLYEKLFGNLILKEDISEKCTTDSTKTLHYNNSSAASRDQFSNVSLNSEQREVLVDWITKERQKRYQHFHQQRDFVQALTNVSEKMRLIVPPEARKKHLPEELEKIEVQEMIYTPLAKASDPFYRILRILTGEEVLQMSPEASPANTKLASFRSHLNDNKNELETIALLQANFKGNIDSDNESKSGDENLSIENVELRGDFLDKFQTESDSIENIDESTFEEIFAGSKQPKSQEKIERKIMSSKARKMSMQLYNDSLSKILQDSGTFGELWSNKKMRLREASPYGHLPGWDVISLISKSNDDIRQEVFALQLISKFKDIFEEEQLPLILRPYRIISTGNSTGLIETITDAQSLDSLKKKEGYNDLRTHFEETYGHSTSTTFLQAQKNFLHSLAAYSIVCYLLQIKDRHNGNIMLSTEGSIVHIDFGFMLGTAPGGNWSIEVSPFKLTKEMVGVLGGIHSELFDEFIRLFTLGMLAMQKNADRILTLVEIMMEHSKFPCFEGRDVSKDFSSLRSRFACNYSTPEIVELTNKLVKFSYNNKWTRRYDKFQKITNGISP